MNKTRFNEEELLRLAVREGLITPEEARELELEVTSGLTLAPAAQTSLGYLHLLLERKKVDPRTLMRLLRKLDGMPPSEEVPMESAPPEPAPSGTAAGRRRYKILNLLGEGGMGKVYKAVDLELNRYVALKFLLSENRELLARFMNEARVQARVDHPNICKVYDMGTLDGRPFIAMQYIDGKPLSVLHRDLSLNDRLSLMLVVARAVHAAHEAGLIHRDLNPRNIMIEAGPGGTGIPIVMDFGLARESAASSLTVTGEIMGSPHYMAPEQARGEAKAMSRRTDVYALGATLYEMVTGRTAFSAENVTFILMKVLHEEPEPPRKLVPGLSVDLEAVILKALEKEIPKRYPTAEALAQDLEHYLNGEPVSVRRYTALDRWIKRARRNKAVTALILSLVGLTLVFSGFQLWDYRRRTIQQHIRAEFDRDLEYVDRLMTHARTSALHDILPELKRARAALAAIEQKMLQRGRLAEPPGLYALGRGHLILQEDARAAHLLREAWDKGYRIPEVSYALGQAQANLYKAALDKAGWTGDPEIYQTTLDHLKKTYGGPALEHLKQSRGVKADSPLLVEALIDHLEDRQTEALGKAREAQAGTPWIYEAHILEGDILMVMAGQRKSAGDLDGARKTYAQAGSAYNEALIQSRSDPRAYQKECARLAVVAAMDAYGDASVTHLLDQADQACGCSLQAQSDTVDARLSLTQVLELRAEIAENSGEDPLPYYARAITIAREAVRLAPEDAEAHHALAILLLDEAKRNLRLARDPNPLLAESLKYLDRALALEPDSMDYYNSHGLAQKLLGDAALADGGDPRAQYRKAAADYEKASRLGARDSALIVLNNLGRVQEAIALYDMDTGGNPLPSLDVAEATYRRALKRNPRDGYLLNCLGNALFARARYLSETGGDAEAVYRESASRYEAAIAQMPDYAYAHGNLGSAWLALAENRRAAGQDPEEALSDAEQALRNALNLKPDYLNALRNLARCSMVRIRRHQNAGGEAAPDFKTAREFLRRASAIQPDSCGKDQAELLILEARQAILRGTSPTSLLQKARAHAQRALAVNSKDWKALSLTGEAWWLETRWRPSGDGGALEAAERSIIALNQSLALNPVQSRSWHLLSRLQAMKAEALPPGAEREALRRESRQTLEKALQINPQAVLEAVEPPARK